MKTIVRGSYMWYVTKIGYITKMGSTIYERFHTLSNFSIHNHNLIVFMQNSVTGELQVLRCRSSADSRAFLAALREYSPYGFVDNNDKGNDDIVFDDYIVPIDDWSMKFISYVDTVKEVRVFQTDPRIDFVRKLKGTCTAVDENWSLFMCDESKEIATLFHVMLYRPDGWFKDNFYLYSRHTLDWGKLGLDYTDIAYKVEFTDKDAAYRLLAKASVAGINPLKDALRK